MWSDENGNRPPPPRVVQLATPLQPPSPAPRPRTCSSAQVPQYWCAASANTLASATQRATAASSTAAAAGC